MTYATQQDLEERFGAAELVQIADRDGDDVADAAVVARALEDADAEINGYLERRYALPLQTVPRQIVMLACDIARYRLFEDRAPETIKERYDAAIARLTEIGRGEVRLGLDTAQETTAEHPLDAQSAGPAPVFGRDNMKGF